MEGKILSVNISSEKGTIKNQVEEIEIDHKGVLGDAHYGDSEKHVSIISIERINEFSAECNRTIYPGEFAENLTTWGMDLSKVYIGGIFKINDVTLKVIQIGKDEVVSGKVFRIIGKTVMVHEGIFCKVLNPGKIKKEDTIKYYPGNK